MEFSTRVMATFLAFDNARSASLCFAAWVAFKDAQDDMAEYLLSCTPKTDPGHSWWPKARVSNEEECVMCERGFGGRIIPCEGK